MPGESSKTLPARESHRLPRRGSGRPPRFYPIGSRICGRGADWRRQYRQQIYALLIEASENWLDIQRARVSARSRLGDALHYIAKHMADLKRLLNNGRIEIDSNVVEW
jgi:hypothetical protein